MKRLIVFLLLAPIFSAGAYAAPADMEWGELSGADAVYDAADAETRSVTGELKLDGSYDVQAALDRLFSFFAGKLRKHLGASLRTGASLIGTAFLCGACGALCGDKKTSELIALAGCCAAVYICASDTESVINEALGAMTKLSDYSRASLPVVFTAAAAGAAVSAAGRYAAVCLAIDVMMNVAQGIILPLVCAYLAICVSCTVLDNALLRSAAGFMKKLTVTVMTAITIVFSAVINITGLVAGSLDAAAVKTAKTVLSTSLPVVGGIISDAASTVLSAAGVIRGSAGAFSLVAVCAMCAEPFAQLGVRMIAFKAASAVAETAPCGKLAVLLDDVGTAAGMLTGMVGAFAVLLFVSFASAMKAVGVP